MGRELTFEIRADNVQAIQAIKDMGRELDNMGMKWRIVGDEAEKTGKKQKSFAESALEDMKRIIGAASPLEAAYKGLREVIALAKNELDRWQYKQDTAAGAAVSMGQARASSIPMLQKSLGMTLPWAEEQAKMLVGQGVMPADAWATIGATGSAAGRFQAPQIAQALNIAGRIAPVMGMSPKKIAPTILDIMRSTHGDAKQSAQLLFNATNMTRIAGIPEAAKSVPEMLQVAANYGIPPEMMVAIAAVLTTRAPDATGEETATATVGLFRTMFERAIYPKKVRKGKKGKRGWTTYKDEIVEAPMPAYINAMGEAPEAENKLLADMAEAGRKGDMATVGRLYSQFTGGKQMPWKEWGPDPAEFMKRQRDPEGALTWVGKQVAGMTDEQFEKWSKGTLTRGPLRSSVQQFLKRVKEYRDQYEESLADIRSRSADPKGFEDTIAAMQSGPGGRAATLNASLAAGAEWVSISSPELAGQGQVREHVQEILKRIQGKTALGESIDTTMMKLKFLAGENPYSVGAQFLKREMDYVAAPEVEGPPIVGPGYTARGAMMPNQYYNPDVAAALNNAVGALNAAAQSFSAEESARTAGQQGAIQVQNMGKPPPVPLQN